ncbi:MAG: hypothetical protein KF889_06465 [Alphaproteobacteria bacterium]|nr:hypothetical protein [Alphaproteobacteria bacterium]MCW5740462.1 hypothetical protein [Alphaproteobacteria bacterium]
MDAYMPRTIVIREADEWSNGKGGSFVFHLIYAFAPMGHDLAADPPRLPTGTRPTGEWRAYLLLSDERSEIVTGWGLLRDEIEPVLRAWLRLRGLLS